MNLRSLELTDFGIYAGSQRLDLTTRKGRPVILVGGTNGAGKTTLLEAFTLCLHGRRALGPRVSQRRYDDHIRSRFHNAPNREPAEECAITLCFDHTQSGRGSEYVATRRWRRRPGGSIEEELRLFLDDEPVDDLSEASRQDFLDSLLPPGLAGFFLFDGEQIQALADDENGDHLAEAVKRLLGLDLIDQLRSDLRRFATRSSTKGSGATLVSEITAAEGAVEKAAEQVALVGERRAVLRADQDRLDARVARARDRLGREGGVLAGERSAVERAARRSAAEAARAEEQLRGLVAGLLPLSISGRLAEGVAGRLAEEQAAEENEVIAARLAASSKGLKAGLETTDGRAVTTALREILGVGRRRGSRRVHEVSAAERAVMIDQLRLVRELVPGEAAESARRLRRARDRGERSRRKLAEIPEDEALAPLVEELQALEHKRGEVAGEMRRLEDDARQAAHELAAAERDLRRTEERARQARGQDAAGEVAMRTVALLEDYGEQTELRRLGQIELEAARYFNRLSRKGELLSKITIDRETFQVRVARWDQTELPKERLSAGEKQLLAIAILWSLAHASRRPLPVVVDTPLARLDQEHRRRLLTEYLPHVSHQVIVLSTDTEVDLAAAATLEERIARKLFLSHATDSAATSVEEGYFGGVGEGVAGGR